MMGVFTADAQERPGTLGVCSFYPGGVSCRLDMTLLLFCFFKASILIPPPFGFHVGDSNPPL